ncbi:hypothetical protein DPMN_059403 [Dreissena polymorpha]|uniref:CCHC-type domain-containing protein n=1 Tax=Dreissena polymorpha TaxID=45954 RepID=A0A9D4C3X8_DREPO|nr:hypothetical protein DPMN_059403 [Dreissena polymorpha]
MPPVGWHIAVELSVRLYVCQSVRQQHDLRNAHLDTRSEYQDCHNENRDFRYVRRHVNPENSQHCTNCGRQNHVTRDCRLPKRQ